MDLLVRFRLIYEVLRCEFTHFLLSHQKKISPCGIVNSFFNADCIIFLQFRIKIILRVFTFASGGGLRVCSPLTEPGRSKLIPYD